jgi:hypothetical protein
MITAKEVEKLAMKLPEEQRTKLAAHMPESLPPILMDEDDGVAEALRRAAEMDLNPTIGISLRDFDRRIHRRR